MKTIFVCHVIIYNISGSSTQLATHACENGVGNKSQLQVVA